MLKGRTAIVCGARAHLTEAMKIEDMAAGPDSHTFDAANRHVTTTSGAVTHRNQRATMMGITKPSFIARVSSGRIVRQH